MSFLLGAFGKLAAGRRVRQLQARMMRVQSKLRRATRQIDTTSKMLETQKKMALNNLSMMQQTASAYTGTEAWVNWFNSQNSQQLDAKWATYGQNVLTGAQDLITGGSNGGIDANDKLSYSAYQTAVQNSKAQQEMMVAQQKNRIEEYFENLNDTMLEPLKMEEDSLQTEKDSLESQIQIAQQDYEACKKMEQSDAKNLAPNYTGQG